MTQPSIISAASLTMCLGSYLATTRLIKTKQAMDFDTMIQFYLHLEPLLGGLITVVSFTIQQKNYLKAIELMDEVSKLLKTLHLKPKLLFVWMHYYLFYFSIIVGNAFYICLSYVTGKSILVLLYDYMTDGVCFHAQSSTLLQFGVFMMISSEIFVLLNEHIRKLDENCVDTITALKQLQTIGDIHFKLCKAINKMNETCSTILLVYTIKSYFEFGGLMLSINGVLPALTVEFIALSIFYSITGIEITINCELMNKFVSTRAFSNFFF